MLINLGSSPLHTFPLISNSSSDRFIIISFSSSSFFSSSFHSSSPSSVIFRSLNPHLSSFLSPSAQVVLPFLITLHSFFLSFADSRSALFLVLLVFVRSHCSLRGPRVVLSIFSLSPALFYPSSHAVHSLSPLFPLSLPFCVNKKKVN